MNTEQKYPLLLKPVIKDYLWGGTRLKTEFGFETDNEIASEGWMDVCFRAFTIGIFAAKSSAITPLLYRNRKKARNEQMCCSTVL